MGALVSALYAAEPHGAWYNIIRPLKKYAKMVSSLWRNLLDLTIPFCSLLTGYAFNRNIASVCGAHRIEDLWLPYFCITTELSNSEDMIEK